MRTMTIRNIPDEVAEQLKFLAKTSKTSINNTIVQVLGCSILPQKARRKRRDLSRFCGGWTQKEFNDFNLAITDCERIDPEDWK